MFSEKGGQRKKRHINANTGRDGTEAEENKG